MARRHSQGIAQKSLPELPAVPQNAANAAVLAMVVDNLKGSSLHEAQLEGAFNDQETAMRFLQQNFDEFKPASQ